MASGHYNTESEKSSGLHIVKVKNVNFLKEFKNLNNMPKQIINK